MARSGGEARLAETRLFSYQSCMSQAVIRHVSLVVGIALIAIICLRCERLFITAQGETGVSLLHAKNPVLAFVAIAVCIAASAVIAGVVGRLTNAVVGLFALGAGLFVLNGRLETVRTVAFTGADASPKATLLLLSLETLFLGILILGATLIVFRIAGALKDVQPERPYDPPHPWIGSAAMKGAAAAVLALIAVWAIAQSPMKGQVVAATTIGGIVVGLVARLISPHVQPVLFYFSPMVAGAIGYVFAMFMLRLPLADGYVAGSLPSFALVMPMDYAVGTLAGVSFGLGWAKSFLHHEENPQAVRT
jgi:hypothetical protein